MLVYRICKTLHARDLKGEGAFLFGGRWNLPGYRCLYTSSSRSLALLEYSVNTDIHSIPRSLSVVTLEIPLPSLTSWELKDLPGNWQVSPPPSETQRMGTHWLVSRSQLVLQVPSAVMPSEINFLINPLHSDIVKLKILEVADLAYHIRIKSR